MARLQWISGGLLGLSLSVAAQAQNPFDALKTFSATIEMSGTSTAGPAAHGDLKMYRSGDNIRTDLPGGIGYSIIDVSQHTSYMMMTNGMCMQMSSPQLETPLSHSADSTIDRTPVGTESIDGHLCKVENVTITPHSGARAGQPSTMKVWEAEDLNGFPIKIEMQTSRGLISMHYKDISLSAPDASLFTHPANCSTMPSMPGMPIAPH